MDLPPHSQKYKLVIFVPTTHADVVREAMSKAGAGKIGAYTSCSFSSRGTGRFLPQKGADPTIGEVGELEAVEEERIEMLCEKELLPQVAEAIKKVHPYEQVILDVNEIMAVELFQTA